MCCSAAAAAELSKLTEECDQRIAEAEENADATVRAVTESAEAQVAEAWAAVEEQASVAASALRSSATRTSSSGTTNEYLRRDRSLFRTSLVPTQSQHDAPVRFSARNHPYHHSKLNVDPVSVFM
jgi:vacuolar-type H+-ATPase subunit H